MRIAMILPELGGTWREYNYDGNSKKGTRANNKNESETIGKGEVFRGKGTRERRVRLGLGRDEMRYVRNWES